jgi:DNA-binding CsgD family transcriptional regulator
VIAERAAKIVRMRAEGKTWHECAAAMKVSYRTAHKHGTRAGAPSAAERSRSRMADERAMAALRLRRLGLTFERIGGRLGVNRRRAHALVRRGARVEARRTRAGML